MKVVITEHAKKAVTKLPTIVQVRLAEKRRMDRLTIEGKEYVVLPKAEYEQLVGRTSGTDALEFVLGELGRNLRAAREHAGLTQAQLARRMKKAQATVSGSETGKIRVSEAYVKKVLKICGLPENWNSREDV